MRIEGRETYPTSPDVIWSLIGEPGMLARMLPGCEVVEPVAPNQYRIELNTRIGKAIEPITAVLTLEEVAPFREVGFRADGQGHSGALSIQGHVSLEDQGPNCTALSYAVDIDGEQFPTVSPRMFETTSRAFVRRSLETLEKQIGIRTRVYTTAAYQPAPVAPAATIQRLAALRRLLAFASILLTLLILWRGIERRRTRRIAEELTALLEEPEDGQRPHSPASENEVERSVV
jgi:carbon monoxide dehydrogenase subunit G